MEIRTLDMEQVREGARRWKKSIGAHQVMVYTMVGGGMLGRFAAQQPADFYVDARVGRLPYPLRAIYQAVKVLAVLAEAAGLNPHHLPEMPDVHACGVF